MNLAQELDLCANCLTQYLCAVCLFFIPKGSHFLPLTLPPGQILMSVSPLHVPSAPLVWMRSTDIAACVHQTGLAPTVKKVDY